MKYLAYYTKERAAYKSAYRTKVSLELALEVLPKIFKHFGSQSVPMRINSNARNWSSYRFGGGLLTPRRTRFYRIEEIIMAPSMMNWLFLAHEVAHALHCHDYDRRQKDTPILRLPLERWHGVEHKLWMRRVIDFLKAEMLIPATIKMVLTEASLLWKVAKFFPAQKAPNKKSIEGWNAHLCRTAMEALPAALKCPRCQSKKPKAAFGVRVMKKSSLGRALKVRRQSYCRECR